MNEKYSNISVVGKKVIGEDLLRRARHRRIVLLFIAIATTITAGTFYRIRLRTPRLLSSIKIDVPARPEGDRRLPIYFWEYLTFVELDTLLETDLFVPYEKGPPQRLISKLLFIDRKTKNIELTLHGKRPRTYSVEAIAPWFETSETAPPFAKWSLLSKLSTEAGLPSESNSTLTFFQLRHPDTNPTRAIGVPWFAANPNHATGHFFFWSDEGGIFPVHCPAPCRLAPLLEHVQFPLDIKGSLKDRKAATERALGHFLQQPPSAHDDLALSLYLISMITIDPRDPELFFHLGKIAHRRGMRAMIEACLLYGKDLGLDEAKRAELESLLTQN